MASSFLRIATWNIDRPTQTGWKKNPIIVEKLREIDADIWVLTETNAAIVPESKRPDPLCGYVGLASLPESPSRPGQNRSTVWSRLGITRAIKTFDSDTAVCAEVETRIGPMLVYGTIITYWADRGKNNSNNWVEHQKEIGNHSADWMRIKKAFPNHIMCVAGDFNQNRDRTQWFLDPTGNQESVDQLTEELEMNSLICVTEQDMRKEKGISRANIDHICVSKHIAERMKSYNCWQIENFTHNGVSVEFSLS